MSGIGHNRAALSPFEAVEADIADLYEEAANWLDGAAIADQSQANRVALLLDMARKSGKAADDLRKSEKAPHAAAAKAVDERFRPLVDKAERVTQAARTAVTAWQVAQEAEMRRQEECTPCRGCPCAGGQPGGRRGGP